MSGYLAGVLMVVVMLAAWCVHPLLMLIPFFAMLGLIWWCSR